MNRVRNGVLSLDGREMDWQIWLLILLLILLITSVIGLAENADLKEKTKSDLSRRPDFSCTRVFLKTPISGGLNGVAIDQNAGHVLFLTQYGERRFLLGEVLSCQVFTDNKDGLVTVRFGTSDPRDPAFFMDMVEHTSTGKTDCLSAVKEAGELQAYFQDITRASNPILNHGSRLLDDT